MIKKEESEFVEQHHQDTIRNITAKLEKDPEILALMTSGSIAHGFQKPSSDVDIMMVISNEHFAKRYEEGKLTFFDTDSCTYEGGYVDGKYVTIDHMEIVADKGSEAARYAFEGATIIFSKVDGLDRIMERIVKYPIEKKASNIYRFFAQFEAYHWYTTEAIKHNNTYLLQHAITKYILFAGRLILAEAEVLYPYHKWFLKVLEKVESKPDRMMEHIELLLNEPTRENIELFYNMILAFKDWGIAPQTWPTQFMKDSELNWMDGFTPIADL
jgi:predicted nucleotidyltransferase